ncbi:hypothetical protein [Streptomyces violascens]|uniref:Uncharacterized protein n=1 Tax=Streptomyces violascens TaxID=67381 RepID=A0ABQ3QSP3_9ACTN|nr:hypothetical protein [Streptomyces violascens]GGU33611.1 hypothetical protein GCM10010289_63610 [Streptomyces violascens]GHI40302.1 hypothetical protein Sviol_47100 [Streptomyces violascens]
MEDDDMPVNTVLSHWRLTVQSIEAGSDLQWVFEWGNQLHHRDQLHTMWPLLSEQEQTRWQPVLSRWDERFRAATAPMQNPDTSVRQNGRWWQDRYPLRVTGESGQELPLPWSPPPTHLDAD